MSDENPRGEKFSRLSTAGTRVQGVLPPETHDKYKQVLDNERQKAAENLRPEPSESSVLAMLIARGIISYWADQD